MTSVTNSLRKHIDISPRSLLSGNHFCVWLVIISGRHNLLMRYSYYTKNQKCDLRRRNVFLDHRRGVYRSSSCFVIAKLTIISHISYQLIISYIYGYIGRYFIKISAMAHPVPSTHTSSSTTK